MNEQHLESVLKKCPNIIRVNLCLAVNSSVLLLIGRYCHRIKSLFYDYTNDDKAFSRWASKCTLAPALSFFRMYGHKLEELYLFKEDNEYFTEDKTENDKKMLNIILNLCPNMTTISLPEETVPLFDEKGFLPKLKAIKDIGSGPKDLNPK